MIKEILTVCAGNVCRSPMAEGMLQALLPGSRVRSAGVHASDGMEVDPNVVRMMQRIGIDVSPHRARRLNQEMCEQADLILVMESAHKRTIDLRYPQGRGKVYCLDREEDVPDPHGKSFTEYEAAMVRISRHTEVWAKRIKAL
jgi:protein-tyrosine phosphatase